MRRIKKKWMPGQPTDPYDWKKRPVLILDMKPVWEAYAGMYEWWAKSLISGIKAMKEAEGQ